MRSVDQIEDDFKSKYTNIFDGAHEATAIGAIAVPKAKSKPETRKKTQDCPDIFRIN